MQRTVQHTIFTGVCLLLSLMALCGCGTQAAQKPERLTVRYMPVSARPFTMTRELPGRVSALTVSEVRPQVGGIIQERLFQEGADVHAGQVLYQIDPTLFQAAYNNAKANLARVEATLNAVRLRAERYGRLVKTGAVGVQNHDDAVAEYEQVKAEVTAYTEALETARINLGYTKVTAPVSGRIGRSFVTPGSLVTQNQQAPLSTVQQLSPVYVDVTQPTSELLRLRRALAGGRLQSQDGSSARVKLKLEDGSPYTGNAMIEGADEEPRWIEGDLLFSDVTVEQSTGVVTLRARFDNPESVLLPGMYVRAVLEEGVRENAILIPQKAVMRDTRGRPLVYVLSKSAPLEGLEGDERQAGAASPAEDEYYVEPRQIRISRDHQNHWLVESGLHEGDLLLVDGLQKAHPGQLVAAVAVQPASAATAVAAADTGAVGGVRGERR